jgi:hypothetical protein
VHDVRTVELDTPTPAESWSRKSIARRGLKRGEHSSYSLRRLPPAAVSNGATRLEARTRQKPGNGTLRLPTQDSPASRLSTPTARHAAARASPCSRGRGVSAGGCARHGALRALKRRLSGQNSGCRSRFSARRREREPSSATPLWSRALPADVRARLRDDVARQRTKRARCVVPPRGGSHHGGEAGGSSPPLDWSVRVDRSRRTLSQGSTGSIPASCGQHAAPARVP